MKILIDMNLSPDWCQVFNSQGIRSLHWSNVGAVSAPDSAIMDWAKNNNYIVFARKGKEIVRDIITRESKTSIVLVFGGIAIP